MYVCNTIIFHYYTFLYKYQAKQYKVVHLWIGGEYCLNFSLLSLLPERSGLFLEVLQYQVNQWQRRRKPMTLC